MDTNKRTAVLIDADNVSTDVAAQVIARLQADGHRLQHRRAYGSVDKAREFAEFSKQHAIRFLPSTFAGPNATDIALAIDAVELVLREPVDEVVLVSSDMDYSPLIVRLRELGCRVTGYGQQGKSGRDIERDYERVYDAFEVIGPLPVSRRGVSKASGRSAATAEVAVETAKPKVTRTRREPAARPARAAKPKPVAPPPLPKDVQDVLEACPDLRAGGPVRLNGVAKALHDHKLLKKNGKTTSLFKKLASHFELLPPEKPESVRFLAA